MLTSMFTCWISLKTFNQSTFLSTSHVLMNDMVPSWYGHHPLLWTYWAGRKVHSGFPIRCYRKTQMNLLANPILFTPTVKEAVACFPLHCKWMGSTSWLLYPTTLWVFIHKSLHVLKTISFLPVSLLPDLNLDEQVYIMEPSVAQKPGAKKCRTLAQDSTFSLHGTFWSQEALSDLSSHNQNSPKHRSCESLLEQGKGARGLWPELLRQVRACLFFQPLMDLEIIPKSFHQEKPVRHPMTMGPEDNRATPAPPNSKFFPKG